MCIRDRYRLALALDLEDEEDERNRIFLKLHQGLERTREQLGKGLSTLFASHGDLSADFWDELEELFIMADMGVEAATELCKRLKSRARAASATTPEELRPLLAAELEDIFRIPRRVVAVNPPEVVLIIGVNGVGKMCIRDRTGPRPAMFSSWIRNTLVGLIST